MSSELELQTAAENAVLEEKMRIVQETLSLHSCNTWKPQGNVFKGCKLETASVSYCPKKVARVATLMKCSLSTFLSCVQNPNSTYDVGLKESSVIGMTPSSKTVYSLYNATTFISARDFCVEMSDLPLTEQQCKSMLDNYEGDIAMGFSHASIPEGASVTGHVISCINHADAAPLVASVIRGDVHTFGFIALTWNDPNSKSPRGSTTSPRNSTSPRGTSISQINRLSNSSGAGGGGSLRKSGDRLLVINLIASDPKGNVPSFVVESTYQSHCERLSLIRKMCESHERIRLRMGLPAEEGAGDRGGSLITADVAVDPISENNRKSTTVERSSLISTTADTVGGNREGLTKEEQQVIAVHNQEEVSLAALPPDVELVEEGDDRSVFSEAAPVTRRSPSPDAPVAGGGEKKQEIPEPTTSHPAPVDKKEEDPPVAQAKAPSPPTKPVYPVLTERQIPLVRKLVSFHNRTDWKMGRVLQGCLFEECKPQEYNSLTASRLSTEVNCSLETFFAFQKDLERYRETDPTLDEVKYLENTDGVETVYTSYKRLTRFIKPRDFCAETCLVTIDFDQASEFNIFGVQEGLDVCIQAGQNSTKAGPVKDYIRGMLYCYGNIAFPVGTSGDKIKVFTLGCADVGGSIPKWMVDAAKEEGCKKLALTKKLLEGFQRERSLAQRKKEWTATQEQKKAEAAQKSQTEAPATVAVAPKEPEQPATVTKPAVEKEESAAPTTTSSAPRGVQDSRSEEPTGTSTQDAFEDDGAETNNRFSSTSQQLAAVEEFQQEEEQLEAFYTEEVDAIINPLTLTHRKSRWDSFNTLENFKVEAANKLGEAAPKKGKEASVKKTIRVSGEMMCSLGDFIAAMNDDSLVKRFDPSVESAALLDSPPFGSVKHIKYKANPKGINTKRDTCSLTVYHLLSDHEAHTQHQLHAPTIRSAVYVFGSVDSKDMPVAKGYERWSVGVEGMIAIATPPEASRIRLFSLVTSTGEKKQMDGVAAAAALKMSRLRAHFEAKRKADLLARSTLVSASSSVQSEPVKKNDPFQLAQARTIENYSNIHWGDKRRVGSCEVRQLAATSTSPTILKITMEYMCSLQTLKQALDNIKAITRYDPTVQSYELSAETEDSAAPSSSNNAILSLRYKGTKSLLAGKRVAIAQSSRFYTQEEAISSGLYNSGVKTAGFVSGGVDAVTSGAAKATAVPCNAYIEQYSYVGLATPPEATRIRVAHLFAAEPQLRAGGPKKKPTTKEWEATIKEGCSRMLFLSVMCEKLEQQREDRLRIQDTTPAAESLKPQTSAVGGQATNLVAAEQLALDPMTAGDAAQREAKKEEPVAQQEVEEVKQAQVAQQQEEKTEEPTPIPAPEKKEDVPAPAAPKKEEIVEEKPLVTPAQLELVRPLFALHGRTDWRMGKVISGCLFEDCAVSYCKLKASRLTTDVACSLEDFEAFLKDDKMTRKNDKDLDTIEYLKPDNGDGVVTVYTNYKTVSRLVTPRDFCCNVTHTHITPEFSQKTFGVSLPHVTYVNALNNSTMTPPKKGYVRGIIHVLGYLASPDVAPGGKGKGIKVTQLSVVDPGGKIPNWILEAAKEESAKKLGAMRELLENYKK